MDSKGPLLKGLIKLRSSMPIFFASSYLNVFATKRYKNFTFADQVFFTVQNSIKVPKIVQQPKLKL